MKALGLILGFLILASPGIAVVWIVLHFLIKWW